MNLSLTGFDHLTGISHDPDRLLHLMTQGLGLRHLLTTVDQDNVKAYHLLFATADGTVVSFFCLPEAGRSQHGANEIQAIALTIAPAALPYWEARLCQLGLKVQVKTDAAGQSGLMFHDQDGQRFELVCTSRPLVQQAFSASIPPQFAIQGLGPITLQVVDLARVAYLLTGVLGMAQGFCGQFQIGTAELLVVAAEQTPIAAQGFGMVHHLALHTESLANLEHWAQVIKAARLPQSGVVDRYWTQSLYFRIAPQIELEIATTGQGVWPADPQALVLPPSLENQRADIQAGLAVS